VANIAGQLSYNPGGKKALWKATGQWSHPDGSVDTMKCEVYFHSITGQRLARYSSIGPTGTMGASAGRRSLRRHRGYSLLALDRIQLAMSAESRRDRRGCTARSSRTRGGYRYLTTLLGREIACAAHDPVCSVPPHVELSGAGSPSLGKVA
jgi:hypothetical protein